MFFIRDLLLYYQDKEKARFLGYFFAQKITIFAAREATAAAAAVRQIFVLSDVLRVSRQQVRLKTNKP